MIAIIAILAAILIPVIGTVRKNANSTKALSSIRQIGISNSLYSQDNQGAIIGQEANNFMGPMRQIANYLTADSNLNVNQQKAVLSQAIDPNVPEDLVSTAQLPFTSSFNSIFNVTYGRFVEGKAPWVAPNERSPNPRRMVEFDYPSDTIYAVSGSYEFSTAIAEDSSLLGIPTSRQPIFYLHGNNDSTPAVFLDGHAELLKFPIDPRRINPNQR